MNVNVKGILFLIWFFVSIGLLLFFEGNTGIIFIIFGQVFFVFGTIFVIAYKKELQKGKDLFILIFPIIGFIAIVLGLILSLNYNIDEDIIFYTFPFIFIITGVLVILKRKIYNNYLIKNCTKKVVGEIVDIDSYYDNERESYTPVYEINLNGNKINIKSNEYTNLVRFEIGQIVELFVNPSNPDEFIDPYRNNIDTFSYFIGISSICGGIFPLIYMLYDIIY